MREVDDAIPTIEYHATPARLREMRLREYRHQVYTGLRIRYQAGNTSPQSPPPENAVHAPAVGYGCIRDVTVSHWLRPGL